MDFRFPFLQPRIGYLTLAAAMTCLAASLGGAFAQTTPAPDPAKLLEQLDKLEEAVKKAHAGHNLAAVDTIREAATSDQKAVSLWIDCVHETDFRGRDKKETDFRAWREGPGKQLSEPGAAGALRLHLHYLVLTIRAANIKTDSERGELLNSALSYLDDLARADKEVLKNRQTLDTSVLATPIARHFKLDITVKPTIEWALSPGDIAAIYETSVLPFLREKKDPTKLQAAWNRRIQQEGALVAVQDSEFLTKTFREIALPALEWGQARDLFRAGSGQSAAKLLQIIQQHQTHKDASSWIAELKTLLTEKSDAAAAPVVSAPPAASPQTTKPPEPSPTSPPGILATDGSDPTAPLPSRELPKPPQPGFPPNLRR